MGSPLTRQKLSRRQFLKSAAVAGAAAAIAGCAPQAAPTQAPAQSSGGSSTQPTTAAPAAAQSTITYWTIWSDQPHEAYLKDAFTRFASSNPNIKITKTFIAGDDSYDQKVNAAIAGHKPPDVLDVTGSPRFGFRKMLTDLTNNLMVSKVISKDDFIPGQIVRNSWGGKIYSIPREADCNAMLWWNKDIFKEVGLDPESPPKTWDEMLSVVEKTQKKDSSGRFSRLGYSPTYSQSWFMVYLWQAGGEVYLPYPPNEGAEPKSAFNDEKGAAALDFMVKLADLGGGEQSMSAYEKGFQNGAQQPFFTGQLAMMCNGDWTFADQQKYAPKLNFGVAQMPIPAGGKVTTSSGGWGYCIPVGAQVDPGFKLVELLSSQAEQQIRLDTLSKLPAHLKVLDSPKLQSDPNLKVAADLLKVAHGFPEPPWGGDEWTIVNVETRDNALFKKMTVQQSLDNGAKKLQDAIHKIYAAS